MLKYEGSRLLVEHPQWVNAHVSWAIVSDVAAGGRGMRGLNSSTSQRQCAAEERKGRECTSTIIHLF
jgi:hypothetical protein